jgi:hypothetical protein
MTSFNLNQRRRAKRLNLRMRFHETEKTRNSFAALTSKKIEAQSFNRSGANRFAAIAFATWKALSYCFLLAPHPAT